VSVQSFFRQCQHLASIFTIDQPHLAAKAVSAGQTPFIEGVIMSAQTRLMSWIGWITVTPIELSPM
jgi:hypothetical protein